MTQETLETTLSTRERQAIAHVSRGLTQKEAAYEMGIAASTLRVLLHRAARKLGCRRPLQLHQPLLAQSAA